MSVGVRTIFTLPAARTLVAFCALVSLLYGTDTVLLIDVSSSRLGLGPEGFGYLLAGLGLGGVLMAAAVNKLAGSARLANIIIAGVAGYCLPTALLVFIHSPALAFATEVFRGGATLIVDVLAVTALQRAVPADSLARVFGVFFAFILGAISLGVIITPPTVHALGLNGALIAMAVGPMVLALMGYPALLAIDRQTAAEHRNWLRGSRCWKGSASSRRPAGRCWSSWWARRGRSSSRPAARSSPRARRRMPSMCSWTARCGSPARGERSGPRAAPASHHRTRLLRRDRRARADPADRDRDRGEPLPL